jgi:surface polysaccharide O-acyltransferase-like enzyme
MYLIPSVLGHHKACLLATFLRMVTTAATTTATRLLAAKTVLIYLFHQLLIKSNDVG